MSTDLFGVEAPAPPKWTERDMLDLLAKRYTKCSQGLGNRYAYAEHVRNGPSWGGTDGFGGLRTCDFIAMDLWTSGNLDLHGHEVKVSRSDWLTELKDPDKSETFRRYMDRWWLVVSDRGIVRDDLPDGWGLMAVAGSTLRVVKRAPRLDPESLPKTMLAPLLRAVTKTAARSA